MFIRVAESAFYLFYSFFNLFFLTFSSHPLLSLAKVKNITFYSSGFSSFPLGYAYIAPVLFCFLVFDFLFDVQRGVWVVFFFFFFVLPRGIWFGVGCLFGSARFGHLHLLVLFLFPPFSLFVVYSFFFRFALFQFDWVGR